MIILHVKFLLQTATEQIIDPGSRTALKKK